ncbi:MAG: hypothetical protein GVY13_14585 [Alphaproteobacteria bacterium]|jgi:hypothetical protein|nr:hypothetical protein [Alphaproteobacteria bacterium]
MTSINGTFGQPAWWMTGQATVTVSASRSAALATTGPKPAAESPSGSQAGAAEVNSTEAAVKLEHSDPLLDLKYLDAVFFAIAEGNRVELTQVSRLHVKGYRYYNPNHPDTQQAAFMDGFAKSMEQGARALKAHEATLGSVTYSATARQVQAMSASVTGTGTSAYGALITGSSVTAEMSMTYGPSDRDPTDVKSQMEDRASQIIRFMEDFGLTSPKDGGEGGYEGRVADAIAFARHLVNSFAAGVETIDMFAQGKRVGVTIVAGTDPQPITPQDLNAYERRRFADMQGTVTTYASAMVQLFEVRGTLVEKSEEGRFGLGRFTLSHPKFGTLVESNGPDGIETPKLDPAVATRIEQAGAVIETMTATRTFNLSGLHQVVGVNMSV